MDERERDGIRQDLSNADEEIRRLGVERLALLDASEALPQLVGCLGDPSWRVRKAAVERLVEAPASWPVADALVEALSDGENPGRRNAAVEALVRSGGRAVARVLEATESGDVDVRKLAVDTLAGIGDPRAAQRLIAMLEDPDSNVRATAADALGVIGGDEVHHALLRVATRAGEEGRQVAFSALRSLARLEVPVRAEQLGQALADELLRPAAFAVLGYARDDDAAVEELLKGLGSSSRSCRDAAMLALVRTLGGLDDASARRLVERIRRASSSQLVTGALQRISTVDLPTRLALVQFLGLLDREETVVPILLAARDDALTEVCMATLGALGELAERALDAAWSDLDAEARRLACETVARTGGATAERRLLAALDDVDGEVRGAAAAALARRGCAEALHGLVRRLEMAAEAEDEVDADREGVAFTAALVELTRSGQGGDAGLPLRTVELLVARLQGGSPPVRLALATALAQLGRHTSVGILTDLLRDPAPGVRRAAVQALADVEGDQAADSLRLALADEAPEVRIAVARTLAESGGPQTPANLERLVADGDTRVRAAALRAVGTYAGRVQQSEVASRAVALLESALLGGGPVALAAVEGLSQVGGSVAADAARRLLECEDAELVRSAVACIGVHGDRLALDDLVPLVAHSHWAVRAEAIGVLAQRGAAKAVPAILRRLEAERDEFVRKAILRALERLDS